VQEQLVILQQLLEVINITKEHRTERGTSTIIVEEAETAHRVLTKIAAGHKILQIETDIIEFPMGKLQEQVKVIRHMNIVVS
jgi:hypothetical protein